MEKSVHTREYQLLLDALRDARRRAGLTQVEVAQRIGESQTAVSRWERGDVRMDVVQLRVLCLAMGVSLRSLIVQWENSLADGGD